jgi:hypothetical protein
MGKSTKSLAHEGSVAQSAKSKEAQRRLLSIRLLQNKKVHSHSRAFPKTNYLGAKYSPKKKEAITSCLQRSPLSMNWFFLLDKADGRVFDETSAPESGFCANERPFVLFPPLMFPKWS